MTSKFIIIERDEVFSESMLLTDENNNILFEDILDMSYEEAYNNDTLRFQQFVLEVLDRSDEYFESDGSTFIGVGDDNSGLVWAVVVERIDGERIRYASIDLEKNSDEEN